MKSFDTFISYASEDETYAKELATGLQENGFRIWFAPLLLKVGDKLLDSIERGLRESRTGVLIITPNYLNKNWTSYEMDILIRNHIENHKTLLPLWIAVSKSDVDKKSAGLSGIVAITNPKSVDQAVSRLIEILSNGAPYRAVIPSYENPVWRFLQGRGEVNLQTEDGPATTIFEYLIHSKPNEYPLWLAGEAYSKKDLLQRMPTLLVHCPEVVRAVVDQAGFKKIWAMCIEEGINPSHFA